MNEKHLKVGLSFRCSILFGNYIGLPPIYHKCSLHKSIKSDF